jgi:flagellar L-ring protein precursor FlgH
MRRTATISLVLLFGPAAFAVGQSSSLFLAEQARMAAQAAASTQPEANGSMRVDAGAAVQTAPYRNLALGKVSLTAVSPAEPRTIRVNDLIGVIVRHRLRYQSDARLQQQSRWDVKSKLDAWFRLHDRKWVQQDFEGGTPELKFKNENNLQNQGRTNRNDIFETRVKAKVIDIKPNGTLEIIAVSRVKIDEEDQYVRLTGMCHKDDIGPDGNVLSDKIFNLDVRTENEGAMKDLAKRGWLKGLMDEFKPF